MSNLIQYYNTCYFKNHNLLDSECFKEKNLNVLCVEFAKFSVFHEFSLKSRNSAITAISFNDDVLFQFKTSLRGPGSSTWRKSKSSFLLFLTEGSVSNQMLFTGSKNIISSRSNKILKYGKYG